MKIIHIARGEAWGGAERHILDLCRALRVAGEDAAAVTRGREAVDGPFARAGVPTRRLPLGGEFDIISPVALSTWLRHIPDRRTVIHVHDLKGASTALRARALCGDPAKEIRVVLTLHRAAPGRNDGRARRLWAGLDRTVFLSEHAREVFLSSGPAIDPARTCVVRGSVMAPAIPEEEEREGREEREERKGGEDSGGTFTLLYLGRVAAGKGLGTLFEALGTLSDLPLRLRIGGVGTGPEVKQLKGEAWRAGVESRVEWLGHLDDVYPEIRRADLGVTPATAAATSGVSALEFMSQGKGCVAVDCGAWREYLPEEAWPFLAADGSAASLAGAIRLAVADREATARAGARCAERFRDAFSHARMTGRIMDIYRRD